MRFVKCPTCNTRYDADFITCPNCRSNAKIKEDEISQSVDSGLICPACKKEAESSWKTCPFCGKVLPISATKKINENKDNTVDSGKTNISSGPSKIKLREVIIAVVIAGVLISFFGVLTGSGCFTTFDGKAKEIVKEHLKAPSTANFKSTEILDTDSSGRKAVVLVTVDAQNSFGAQIESDYIVGVYDKNASAGDSRHVIEEIDEETMLSLDDMTKLVKTYIDWGKE